MMLGAYTKYDHSLFQKSKHFKYQSNSSLTEGDCANIILSSHYSNIKATFIAIGAVMLSNCCYETQSHEIVYI